MTFLSFSGVLYFSYVESSLVMVCNPFNELLNCWLVFYEGFLHLYLGYCSVAFSYLSVFNIFDGLIECVFIFFLECVFLNYFIFGCARSLLLSGLLSRCCERGLLFAGASLAGSAQASVVVATDSVLAASRL